jgi:hypothetical protein
MESLSRPDRDAIIQRFFTGEDLASIGRSCGITDDAAQKRISRALEKLRSFFARRGVATSSSALGAAIASHAAQGAPAGLAASAAQVALVQAASAGGGFAALTTFFIMGTKIKVAIVTTVAVVGVATIVVQRQENRRLRAELATARAAPTAVSPAITRVLAGASAQPPTAASVNAAAPLAKFTSSEIDAIMARVIRDELWETDHAAFQSILDRIDGSDMPAALAYAWANTTGQKRRNLRFQLAEHWARREPASVAAWCRQSPPSADQQQINLMVSSIWAGTDPEAALRFAPSGEGFRQLTLRSPAQAGVEALRLPPGDTRNMAISVIANTRLEQDPRGAVQWLETLSGDDRAVALSAMIPELTGADPQAVAGYVAGLTPTERAVQVTRDFAVVWANQDPAAAARWSAALPEGSPQRRQAVRGVAEIWTQSDPAPAAAWASGLPLDATRDDAIKTVTDVWLQFDPTAARRWLMQTSLPDETKRALLKNHAAMP